MVCSVRIVWKAWNELARLGWWKVKGKKRGGVWKKWFRVMDWSDLWKVWGECDVACEEVWWRWDESWKRGWWKVE